MLDGAGWTSVNRRPRSVAGPCHSASIVISDSIVSASVSASAEVPASRAGVIVAIEVALEDTIPIGTVIVRIADSADETAEAGAGAAASSTPAT